MKYLKPQKNQPKYYEPIEKELAAIFYEILFKPTIDIIKRYTDQRILLNARIDKLEAAIKAGTIQYADGVFSGKFNAGTSKELRDIGAKWDQRSKVFRINPQLTPDSIRVQAGLIASRAKEMHAEIQRALDNTQKDLDNIIQSHEVPTDGMIEQVDSGWQAASKAIAVQPVLTPVMRKKMAEQYNTNIKTYAQKFTEERFKAIRDDVQENSLEGYRFDTLIDRIHAQADISAKKARFIARQETSLFVASFRQERFREAGVSRYRWSARGPGITRPDHFALHGKIFRYDDPPIVDTKTGRKGNPGQDFGCLCADIPLMGTTGE
jgi:SPP1 gp7 family putative phage head morphogenesis protein